jgi:hypothetical protein
MSVFRFAGGVATDKRVQPQHSSQKRINMGTGVLVVMLDLVIEILHLLSIPLTILFNRRIHRS